MFVTITTIFLPMIMVIFCYYRILVLARRQSRKILNAHLQRTQLVPEGDTNRKTASCRFRCSDACYFLASQLGMVFYRSDNERLLYKAKNGISLALGRGGSFHILWNQSMAIFTKKQRVQKRNATWFWHQARHNHSNSLS